MKTKMEVLMSFALISGLTAQSWAGDLIPGTEDATKISKSSKIVLKRNIPVKNHTFFQELIFFKGNFIPQNEYDDRRFSNMFYFSGHPRNTACSIRLKDRPDLYGQDFEISPPANESDRRVLGISEVSGSIYDLPLPLLGGKLTVYEGTIEIKVSNDPIISAINCHIALRADTPAADRKITLADIRSALGSYFEFEVGDSDRRKAMNFTQTLEQFARANRYPAIDREVSASNRSIPQKSEGSEVNEANKQADAQALAK